jgi:hypothetical protein
LDLKAHTSIRSTASQTTLTQTFGNPSKDTARKNVKYTFPLYDGVSVVAFKCEIGDRVINGIVKPRAKAKAEYDDAVKKGRAAALLEQSMVASDTFTTSIGEIPAGSPVVVHITYLGELQHDAQADGIRFSIPTVIAPRYASLNLSDLPDNLSSVVKRGKVDITVDVEMPGESKIQSLQSPSHPVTITLGRTSVAAEDVFEPNFASAAFETRSDDNGVYFTQDFVIIVKAKNQDTPSALLETHPDFPNHRAIMTTLVPKFNIPNSNPEIIFIIDRSGSMEPQINTLKSALQVFLKSLPVGIKFNICSFGSHHSFMWDKSQTYDASTLDKALKYVGKIDANMGGTEMLAPVKAAVQRRFKDMETEILILTDGEIWNQQLLFDFINKEVAENPIRCFTLGIGDNVSHSLIQGIARAGNGFSQAVGNNEQMDRKIVRMLKGALTPHIKDYTLEIEYDQADDDDYEIVEKSNDIPTVTIPVRSKDSQAAQPISLFDTNYKEQEIPTSVDNDANLPALVPPKILQAPYKIPALYPFSRTSVYLLLSPETNPSTPKSVILRGTSRHGPLTLTIPVEDVGQGTAFHQLAVKKLMLELEEGRGWVYDAKDANGKLVLDQHESKRDAIIEREAERLGVKFQVGGKHCSFIAVEQDKNNEAMTDAPIEIPAPAYSRVPDRGGPQGYGQQQQMLYMATPAFAPGAGRGGGGGGSRGSRHAMRRSAIDAVTMRGETLNSLSENAERLAHSAGSFYAASKKSKTKADSLGGFFGGSLFGGGSGSRSRSAAVPCAAVSEGVAPSSGQQASLFGAAPPPETIDSDDDDDCTELESAPEPYAQPDNKANTVHAVISQQQFEGSWDWTLAIFSTMGITAADVERLDWAAILGMPASSDGKVDLKLKKIIVTLAVAAFLQRRCSQEKETWDLIFEKAMTWIEGAVAGVGGSGKGEAERLAPFASLFP